MIREEKKEKLFFYLMFAGLIFGGLLVLQACAPSGGVSLEGTTWNLQSIGGSSLVEDTAITLTFEDGQAGGSACNSYGASYTVKGDKLTFDQIMMTEMYCVEPEGVMEQESGYLDALARAQTFEVKENELWITLDDGDVLLFTSA